MVGIYLVGFGLMCLLWVICLGVLCIMVQVQFMFMLQVLECFLVMVIMVLQVFWWVQLCCYFSRICCQVIGIMLVWIMWFMVYLWVLLEVLFEVLVIMQILQLFLSMVQRVKVVLQILVYSLVIMIFLWFVVVSELCMFWLFQEFIEVCLRIFCLGNIVSSFGQVGLEKLLVFIVVMVIGMLNIFVVLVRFIMLFFSVW